MERLEKIFFQLLLVLLAVFGVLVAMLYVVAIAQIAQAEQIEPEIELTTTTVIVHWYDSEQELQNALGWDDTAGYSECEFRPDFNTSFCELWLVRPTSTDDAYNFDTIGHEFYHALTGDFHDGN